MRRREGTMRTLRMVGMALTFALITAAPAGAGIGAMATGSGHFTEPDGWRTFAFTARELPDGEDRGSAQVRGPFGDGDIVLHLQIDCLAVSGTTAVATGTVHVRQLPPGAPFDPDGIYAIFAVRDNGEGAGIQDQVTTLSPAAGPCSGTPGSFHPIEAGNIQVTS
jgi:hypothetical protein